MSNERESEFKYNDKIFKDLTEKFKYQVNDTIFKACYDGRLRNVKAFLDSGANVNEGYAQVRDYVHI